MEIIKCKVDKKHSTDSSDGKYECRFEKGLNVK